jgi:hypothetical protein
MFLKETDTRAVDADLLFLYKTLQLKKSNQNVHKQGSSKRSRSLRKEHDSLPLAISVTNCVYVTTLTTVLYCILS